MGLCKASHGANKSMTKKISTTGFSKNGSQSHDSPQKPSHSNPLDASSRLRDKEGKGGKGRDVSQAHERDPSAENKDRVHNVDAKQVRHSGARWKGIGVQLLVLLIVFLLVILAAVESTIRQRYFQAKWEEVTKVPESTDDPWMQLSRGMYGV